MSLLRPDLEDIAPYTRPPEPVTNIVRLHMNEAAKDWPIAAKAALLARLRDMPFQQYPERQAELSERLRKRLGAPEGGLLLGPSSGNLLDHIALAGLSPGDSVAIPDPGFSLYPMLIQRHGAKVQRIAVGTEFPLEGWFQALDCRQLWITLPNNPTGAWLAPEAIQALLEKAASQSRPPLIVLDEAYAEFAPRTHRLSVDRYPNVLLLRTFSKALASASWRLGYVLGDPALMGKLAALQLPYSISAASLEALDVALDFASDFESEIRESIQRRDCLAMSLPEHQIAPSAANFLHVTPDPSSLLLESGLLARALPGSGAARVGIGDETSLRQTAQSMGQVLREPASQPPKKLLVLDVDGVLIDADRSFSEAVSLALKELRPGLPWSDAHFRAFKRIGGFNNDYALAAAACVLAENGGDRDLLPELQAAVGKGFPDLDQRIAAFEAEAEAVVHRCYIENTVQLERPLITLNELQNKGWELAILTGRPPKELVYAWRVLGFELPAICDSAPHLRKPLPSGLLQLADAFRAEEILFVGDTRDDATCLRAAQSLRPELRWRFAGVGPDRSLFTQPEDLKAPSLRDLLNGDF
jgi:histidinol-phosphate aminotransferase